MRLALQPGAQRRPYTGAGARERGTFLALATTGGAKLMRRDHELGRLAEGYLADHGDGAAGPYLPGPGSRLKPIPRDLVLLRARADDVDKVLIAGEVVVLDDGRPTRFDHRRRSASEAGRAAWRKTAFPDDAASRVSPRR